jgi:tripartite ATP-independent transporter DctM subunit
MGIAEGSLLLFGGLFGLMAFGVPIAVALGLAGALVIALAGLGVMAVPINAWAGVAKYPLLALPVFILTGLVFERAGVATRLVRFCAALVGQRAGSLGVVAVLVCMVLGGISGSGPADAAAVAAVLLPSMVAQGYPAGYAASLIAAAGSTALLIPPSLSFIIYSVLVPGATVPALFAAGLIPGLLAGAALLVPNHVLSRVHGFGTGAGSGPRLSRWRTFKEASWGLLAPVIILGGLRSGLFTPTEAAVVAAAYGLFVGVVVYGTLGWRDIIDILADAAEVSGVVMIIIALAAVFAHAGSTLGTFDAAARLLVGWDLPDTALLLVIMGVILVAGMFLDATSIFLIFLPILIPLAIAHSWDLVWFGVLLTMNVAIGQFTPPLAVNLMVTCRIAGIGMEQTLRWVGWLVLAMGMALTAVLLVPELALWLPRTLGY